VMSSKVLPRVSGTLKKVKTKKMTRKAAKMMKT
jgi:RNase P/RNase MRP subunit POP5